MGPRAGRGWATGEIVRRAQADEGALGVKGGARGDRGGRAPGGLGGSRGGSGPLFDGDGLGVAEEALPAAVEGAGGALAGFALLGGAVVLAGDLSVGDLDLAPRAVHLEVHPLRAAG